MSSDQTIPKSEVRRGFAVGFAVLGVGGALFSFTNGILSNASVTQRIQNERVRSIIDSCAAQNVRHDQTIATLDSILGRAEKRATTKTQRDQITESRAATILLINALAPKTADCRAAAQSRVKAGL